MSMGMVVEEFKKVSRLNGEWEGQVVQEGNPRLIKAILKVTPSTPPGPDKELMRTRVFFVTKLSEGIITPNETPEEILATALTGEEEIAGEWVVQMRTSAPCRHLFGEVQTQILPRVGKKILCGLDIGHECDA
jgi:hypothetical protein